MSEGNYFVLYNRDMNWEKGRKREFQMYEGLKKFHNETSAVNFALSRMGTFPVLAKVTYGTVDEQRIKNMDKPYVVAAFYEDKYNHYCYDGSSDPIPTYEVFRCGKSELEEKMESLAGKGPDKLYAGIELKLFNLGEQ